VELRVGDLTDPDALAAALEGTASSIKVRSLIK
jgi:hypothetical protein